MTTEELVACLNSGYGIHSKWPAKYCVGAETFGHVARSVIERASIYKDDTHIANVVDIIIGPNNGIMFKGVEIIFMGM